MITRRLGIGIVLALVLLSVASIAVPAIRHSLLRAAGRTLVANECVGSADIIVVSGEAEGDGVLEAYELVHSGVATRVAVFSYAPNTIEREFIRRGIPYEGRTARSVRQLKTVGLVNVEQLPTYITGSQDEGPALARWCDEQQFHSVVVVATPDHSRRLRRLLHRAMKGHQTAVAVCPTRYAEFDPDRWWNSHDGIRTEIEELEKLILDCVRHPIS